MAPESARTCGYYYQYFAVFFLEDLRQENEEIEKKDELVQDLAIVVSEDLRQIEALRATLEASLSCIETLQDDIAARHENLGDLNALETLLCVEVGHSFSLRMVSMSRWWLLGRWNLSTTTS